MRSREFTNLLCLGGLNGVNLLVPIVTLPVLSGALGGTSFGELMFVLLAIQISCLVVDYAFAYSGVRALSDARAANVPVAAVFDRVQSARALLACAILPAGMAAFHGLSFESGAAGYVIYVVPYLVGHLLTAQWFQQGMSDLTWMSGMLALTRLAYLAAAVLLVREADDLHALLLVNAGAMLVAGAVVAARRARVHGTRLAFDARGALPELHRGANVFVGDFAPNLYNNLPNLFLAGAVPPVVYGAYMASVRILGAAQTVAYTITNAYFPTLSARQGDARRFYAMLCVGSTCVIAAALAVFADRIVALLLAPEFAQAATFLRVTAVGLVFVAIALVAGPGTLVARGHDVAYRNVSLVLSIVGGALAIAAVPQWGAWGAAGVLLATRAAIGLVLALLALRVA